MLAILGDLLGAGIAAARLRQRIARTEVERERLRLAADIHDGLAQDLALAKREIALLDSEPPPDQASESRARLREAVGAAHRIVRARLEDLSTRVPIGGLHDAVAAACDRARERGLPVELRAARGRRARRARDQPRSSCASSARRWPTSSATPQAGHVLVTLDGADGALALTVEDDGRGLGALDDGGPGDGHFGIALMRERAASIGGRFAVGPGAAGGTRVRLEVPRA